MFEMEVPVERGDVMFLDDEAGHRRLLHFMDL